MTPIEYIEATGSQIINTGIPGNTADLYTRLVYLPTAGHVSETAVFGASWAETGYFLMVYNGAWRFHSRGAVANAGTADLVNPTVLETSRSLFVVNDVEYPLSGAGTDSSNNIQLLVVPNHSGGGGWGRIYEMQMYSGTTLLRDFIPVLDENNRPALYDSVSDAYFYNTGTGEFTPGDPLREYFTVEYNAAGGFGEMSAQRIFIDEPTALTTCTFTREDYIFSGWATEQGGPVVYSDAETVENIAESGETVTLYAVWTPAPMSIVLQYNSSDRDHLDKELENIHTLYGVFREECEITDPVILLEGDPVMLQGVNYFTINALGRSYYLTGCRVIRTNLIEISGHVDVLSSFKNSIRQQVAIVRRAESGQAYNLYLNDGSLHVYADPYILTEPFPAGFTSPSFILAVAGSAGP